MKGSREIHSVYEVSVSRASALMSLGYSVTFYGDMLDGKPCWVVEFSK